MQRVWTTIVIGCVAAALLMGRASEASASLLAAGEESVRLMLMLLGSMTLWSGLLEILAAAGDLARLSRWMRLCLRGLFGGLQDAEAWGAISMSIAANLLGLGNASTPAGVRAAQLLAAQGENGRRALAMLMVINNAGLQLLPTTVITLRQAAGAADAGDFWGVSILAAAVGLVVSCMVLRMIQGGRGAA